MEDLQSAYDSEMARPNFSTGIIAGNDIELI